MTVSTADIEEPPKNFTPTSEQPTYLSILKVTDRQPWYTNKRRVLLNMYIAILWVTNFYFYLRELIVLCLVAYSLLANFADGYDGEPFYFMTKNCLISI